MRKTILLVAPVALLLLSGCGADPSTVGSGQNASSDSAVILRSDEGPLTPPSSDLPSLVASQFLLAQGAVASTTELAATEAQGRNGVTHVRMTQTLQGLRVHGAYAKVAISSRGEVIQAIFRLGRASGALAPARITAREALFAALNALGYSETPGAGRVTGERTDFEATEQMFRDPSAERVAFVDAAGDLAVGYLVETWSKDDNQLDHTLVDGDGQIVSIENRTASDSYKVFQEDPLKGAQTVVAGPGAGNAQSPSGWLSGAQNTILINGNNVKAYLDAVSNNSPDTGGTTVTDGNFVTTVDLNQAPSTTNNRNVAVQNLFYFNNMAHDILRSHGFNEAAGNFQVNNFGNGGAGNDPVLAEAQDGGGTDNANFATPADGSSPRMQMYLWTGAAPSAFVTVGTTDYGAYYSAFGAVPTTTGTTGALAVYNDGTGVASDGCEVSTVSLTGKVAIVDRGTCNFTNKVLNAQKAGAVAVVIVNNDPNGAFSPGGSNKQIKIPSAMVSLADGTTLKGLAGQSGKLRKNPTTPLQIDGDLDADIVYHEYGHGLSWRMIGGMSGKLAGAIGEGAADVNAFLIDGDDRIGEYAYSNPLGIRRYAYSGYPLTYSDVDGGEVHNDGEVYAGAMWRVYQNYLAAGLTASDLQDDFVDGMNFTPSTPAFEDMRDGMLASLPSGSSRACLIWHGFADSGIGVGADGTVAPSGTVTINETFTVPGTCP